MTTETSNARGEVVAWKSTITGEITYSPDWHKRNPAGWRPLVYADAAPPPAAARGDVRGLVAKAIAQGQRLQWPAVMDALQQIDSLAAEGVQAGEASAVVCLVSEKRYPHFAEVQVQLHGGYEPKNGDRLYTASALSQQPSLQQISDYLHGLDTIRREVVEREARALAQQPEARGVVDDESVEDEYLSLLDWLFKERGHSNDDPIYSAFSAFVPKLQTLAGERNGR